MDNKTTDRKALFKDRNFKWLIYGGAISLLGDQFTLIALPWLVLKMTGDTLALGAVLALIAVPRALFILVGGAIVDRYSPKSVLMLTKHVSTVLLGLLAAGVVTGVLTLPMIYVLALGIGLASAFSIPSGTSIMPRVMQPAQLPAANSVMMGMRQLSMFIGPLAAGLMVALGGDVKQGDVSGAHGLALAFAFDALSFALSAWTLSKVQLRPIAAASGAAAAQTAPAAQKAPAMPVWMSIKQGLQHVGSDTQLLTLYLYWTAVAILVLGPLQIALPVLASSHPELGASALGIMAGSHGAGTLIGMIASGINPNLRLRSLGATMILFDVVIGLLFMPMGLIQATWQGALLMLVIGTLGGAMQVSVFTWLQRRVPLQMLGRSMALFMFIFMGLVPIASAVTGWVLKVVTLTQLFAGCGGLLVVVALLAAVVSPLRRVGVTAAA
ncbi:MFS transporter [Caenimonas koreensis]|uniref:MFS transporter n=1 Tax=Caenimonas koreensis TaxID=367474 RepID=UPI003782D8FE